MLNIVSGKFLAGGNEGEIRALSPVRKNFLGEALQGGELDDHPPVNIQHVCLEAQLVQFLHLQRNSAQRPAMKANICSRNIVVVGRDTVGTFTISGATEATL